MVADEIKVSPILGSLAGENADYVIVTNEDPYDEDPELIINQVSAGAELAGKKKIMTSLRLVIVEAIAKALTLAEKDDLVLITTAKGALNSISVWLMAKKIPWDDRRIVREELSKIKQNSLDI